MDHGLYARSFEDVYDAWYSDLDDPTLLVSAFQRRLDAPSALVELGSGTGRLAGPLAAAGFSVTGVDISPSMLAVAPLTTERVAADMTALPLQAASAAGVFIAYNTLFNLASPVAQQRCWHELARILRPRGLVAIETFIAPTSSAGGFGISSRPHPTDGDRRLVLVTGPSRDEAGVTIGSHIEVGGATTTCRPWEVAYQSPAQLDAKAQRAGLRLVDRFGGWDESPFDSDGARHVSWYRKR